MKKNQYPQQILVPHKVLSPRLITPCQPINVHWLRANTIIWNEVIQSRTTLEWVIRNNLFGYGVLSTTGLCGLYPLLSTRPVITLYGHAPEHAYYSLGEAAVWKLLFTQWLLSPAAATPKCRLPNSLPKCDVEVQPSPICSALADVQQPMFPICWSKVCVYHPC